MTNNQIQLMLLPQYAFPIQMPIFAILKVVQHETYKYFGLTDFGDCHGICVFIVQSV